MSFDRKMSHRPGLVLVFCLLVIIAGCSLSGKDRTQEMENTEPSRQPIVRHDGEMSRVISLVHTTRKELALTFSGMADRETMLPLLDTLDRYQLRATFFLPGTRVAEEPDIALEILARGHEIENNTLDRSDPDSLDYAQIYTDIQLANQVLMEKTNVMPRYVRTTFGNFNDDVRLAVAGLGMEAVVTYTLNLNTPVLEEWTKGTEEQRIRFLRNYMNRGGVLALDTTANPYMLEAIPYIVEAAAEVGYALIPFSELISGEYERKPLEQIPGYDAAQINLDLETAGFNMFDRIETKQGEVFLTFDDWGTDYTVTKILNILEAYDVRATFFLRADGPALNPNLAKAIVEAGHDVANHTYSHPVITRLTVEEVQEEVVQAHYALTEAIQQKPLMLFRPPTGAIDEVSANAVAATGYRQIAMYDVTTFDWDNRNSAEDIINGVMERTQEGSIILLHILDDIHTAEALPTIIEGLRNKGYTFGKLGDHFNE